MALTTLTFVSYFLDGVVGGWALELGYPLLPLASLHLHFALFCSNLFLWDANCLGRSDSTRITDRCRDDARIFSVGVAGSDEVCLSVCLSLYIMFDTSKSFVLFRVMTER